MTPVKPTAGRTVGSTSDKEIKVGNRSTWDPTREGAGAGIPKNSSSSDKGYIVSIEKLFSVLEAKGYPKDEIGKVLLNTNGEIGFRNVSGTYLSYVPFKMTPNYLVQNLDGAKNVEECAEWLKDVHSLYKKDVLKAEEKVKEGVKIESKLPEVSRHGQSKSPNIHSPKKIGRPDYLQKMWDKMVAKLINFGIGVGAGVLVGGAYVAGNQEACPVCPVCPVSPEESSWSFF